MTIEQDEITDLEDRLSARFEAILAQHDAAQEHHEDLNTDGTEKLHTKRVRVRLFAVILAMGTFAGADHYIHLDWMGRSCEVFIAAFFDYWLNGAAAKGMAPKVNIPIRRGK